MVEHIDKLADFSIDLSRRCRSARSAADVNPVNVSGSICVACTSSGMSIQTGPRRPLSAK